MGAERDANLHQPVGELEQIREAELPSLNFLLLFPHCIVLYCIVFVFHESIITIKRDVEHVKGNTSNSVINVRNHTR